MTHSQPSTVQVASFDRLDTATLYALLRLRADVFVVEQQCAYPDIDGRDLEPGTRHVWIGAPPDLVGYLRILDEGDEARIGRVCVRPSARGSGVAVGLMQAALDEIGGRRCVLGAQAHLQGWYERLGFSVDGPEYDEDGIPHIPMRRDPARGAV